MSSGVLEVRIWAVALLLCGLLGSVVSSQAEASLFSKNSVDLGIAAFKDGSFDRARDWLSTKEAADDPRAWFYLGKMYQEGLGGLAVDPIRAEKLFHQAAEQDQPQAMLALADIYTRGAGVRPNLLIARAWYEKAAKAGEVAAMVHLADDLTGKYGLPTDYDKARIWYEQAAATGDTAAMRGLAVLYRSGWGVDVSRVEALKWYRLALRFGDQEAAKPEALMSSLTSPAEQAQADSLATEWQGLVSAKTPEKK